MACAGGVGTHRRSALRGIPRGTARRPSPWQSTLAAEQVHLVGQAAAGGPLRTLTSAKASARRARTAAPAQVRPGAIVCKRPRPEEAAWRGGTRRARGDARAAWGAGGGVGAEEGRARRSGARGAGGAGRAGRRRQQLHPWGWRCPAAHHSGRPGTERPRVPLGRRQRCELSLGPRLSAEEHGAPGSPAQGWAPEHGGDHGTGWPGELAGAGSLHSLSRADTGDAGPGPPAPLPKHQLRLPLAALHVTSTKLGTLLEQPRAWREEATGEVEGPNWEGKELGQADPRNET